MAAINVHLDKEDFERKKKFNLTWNQIIKLGLKEAEKKGLHKNG